MTHPCPRTPGLALQHSNVDVHDVGRLSYLLLVYVYSSYAHCSEHYSPWFNTRMGPVIRCIATE